MIIKNNTKSGITKDGFINLCASYNINNKTDIPNELFKIYLLNYDSDNKVSINIFYSNVNNYVLELKTNKVNIYGKNDSDILLGFINLISLMEKSLIQQNQVITDKSNTEHRELMIDIARNIVSLEEIKKIVDEMFRNRINYLHLHFSDDQNYAIESKIHPELNTENYLSSEEIKDLISYCRTRKIEIIPEFDVPGHMNHILEINNKLRCNPKNGNSICFAKNHEYIYELLDEICSIFPSNYFHIGADEINFKNQKECPECRELMIKKGYNNVELLSIDFVNNISRYLQGKGKTVIAWNDILKYGRINHDVIIQKWFNYPFDQAPINEYERGRNIIVASSSNNYFDMPYSLIPLFKTYNYLPEINNQIIEKPYGVSSHIWTEIINDTEELERKLFPRLQAFGENAWLNNENLDYKDFLFRLKMELTNLKMRGINYNSIDTVDSISIDELMKYLRNKLKFEEYTNFSNIALLKMINDYFKDRKIKTLIKK